MKPKFYFYALAVAALLFSPGAALAQSAPDYDLFVWNNGVGLSQTVNDGNADADGRFAPSTVTMWVHFGVGANANYNAVERTVSWKWEQITAATYSSDSTHQGTNTNVTGGLLPTSDPNYVQLMGTPTVAGRYQGSPAITSVATTGNSVEGSETFMGAGPFNLERATVTFQAPNVDGQQRLYFRAVGTTTHSTDTSRSPRARFFRITVNDNYTVPAPTVRPVARTVAANAELTIDLTAGGDDQNVVNAQSVQVFQTAGPIAAYAVEDFTDTQTPANNGQRLVITAPNIAHDAVMDFTIYATNIIGLQTSGQWRVTVTGHGGPPTPTPDNIAPVAVAGPDVTVRDGRTVTLRSSLSRDVDGSIRTYFWMQTAGTTQITFRTNPRYTQYAGRNGVIAVAGGDVFFDANVATDSDLTFQLWVTDDKGATDSDEVTISVTGAVNDPPVIGLNTVLADPDSRDLRARPGDTVRLFAGAYDPEGGAITYAWAQSTTTPTPAVSLSDATAAEPTFTAPDFASGNEDLTLTFDVTVSDFNGGTATASRDVVITASPILPTPPPVPLSQSFRAIAPDDFTVAGGAEVLLAAGDSIGRVPHSLDFRNYSQPAVWTWTQVNGAAVTLTPRCVTACVDTDPNRRVNDLIQTFTAPAATAQAQHLVFRLSRSVDGVNRSDSVTITIDGTGTATTLAANAGGDQASASAGFTITLTGSATGGPTSGTTTYKWWQSAGPAVTLSDATAASPTFTAPATVPSTTVMRFQLVVSKGGETSPPDEVVITFPIVGGAPTVNVEAGPNQIVDEGDTVTLAGSSTTSGATLRWTQYDANRYGNIDVPVTLSDPTAGAATFTAPQLAQTTDLYFSLAVSTDTGYVAVDHVRIRVVATNAAPAVSLAGRWCSLESPCFVDGEGRFPYAAGPIAAEENGIIYLRATVTDDDLAPHTLTWDKTAGPDLYSYTAAGERQMLNFPGTSLAFHNTGTLNFGAPQAAADYTLTFSVTATDAAGVVSSPAATITINVTVRNDAPVLSIPVLAVEPGDTVDLSDGATVIDDNPTLLTYAWQQVERTALSQPDDAADPTASCGGGIRFERTLTYSPGNNGVVYTPVKVPIDPACRTSFVDITSGHADLVTLSGASTFAATFTATFTPPGGEPSRDLYFRLTVNDDDTEALRNIVIRRISVRANPFVSAGPDEAASEGLTINLDGSESEGTVSSLWTQTAGPAVTIADPSRLETSFTVPDLTAETTFTFTLTGTAADGSTSSDTVDVVAGLNLKTDIVTRFTKECLTHTNPNHEPPDDPDDPGSNQCGTGMFQRLVPTTPESISVAEGGNVGLTSHFIDDWPYGDLPITYKWEQVSGPGILNPTAAGASVFAFSAPTPLTADASVVIRLTVSREGITASDTITVNVTAATSPSRPTATIQTSQTVTLGADGQPDTDTLTDISGSVAEGTVVRLNGSGTAAAASGTTLAYVWRQTSPASPQVLRNVPGASNDDGHFYFTAPEVLNETVFTFSLTVLEHTDGDPDDADLVVTFIGSMPQTTTVTVAAGTNDPPVINSAGPFTVAEGETLALSASVTDPEGEAVTYAWTQTNRAQDGAEAVITVPVTLSDATAAEPTFTAPNLRADNVILFSLVVTDASDNASAARLVQITITADNDAPEVTIHGGDRSIAEDSTLTLNAIATDPEGEAMGYRWHLVSVTPPRRHEISFSNARAQTPTVNNLRALTADAVLVFRVTVTDSTGAQTSENVTITVTDVDDDAPDVDAGADISAAAGSLVRLSGTGSDPEGGVVTYAWRQTAGPSVSLTGEAQSSTPTFVAPDATSGTLTFELAVTDPGGNSGMDTVNVTLRAGATDTTLSALRLSVDGFPQTLTPPTFAAGTRAYTLNVVNGITALTVFSSATDANAYSTVLSGANAAGGALTVDGDVISGLTIGANTVTVTVTAENRNDTGAYTVTVTRAGATNTNADLVSLSIDGATITETFAAATTDYTVPAAAFGLKDNLVINAVASQDGATIAYAGTATDGTTALTATGNVLSGLTVATPAAANEVTVTVTAPDGSSTKAYTIDVTVVAAGTANTLSSLSLTAVSSTARAVDLTPAFAAATLEYTITVPNSTQAVRVRAVSTDPGALVEVGTSLTGIGTVGWGRNTCPDPGCTIVSFPGLDIAPVEDGWNVLVRVTPEDGGTAQTYTLAITRTATASDVSTLTGLDLSPTPTTALAPSFSSSTTAYTATVPYAAAVNGLQVVTELGHSGQSISIEGHFGDASATPPTNVPLTFSDGRLRGLQVGANTVRIGVLSEADAGTNRRCPPAVFEGPSAATCGSVFALTDNNVNIYTVTVTVAAAGTAATLSALSLSAAVPVAITPAFDAATTAYTATVPNSITAVSVNATATDGGAGIAVSGADSLNAGENAVTITVTPEDGTTAASTYTVTVTRTGAPGNTDRTLSGLRLSHVTLDPTFDATVESYSATLPYSLRNDLRVFATPNQSNTAVSISGTQATTSDALTVDGNRIGNLAVGVNNIEIATTAPDSTTTGQYAVSVTLAAEGTDASLSALSLGSTVTLTPAFDADTTEYTATVGGSRVLVTATAVDPYHSRFNITGTSGDGSGGSDGPLTVVGDPMPAPGMTADLAPSPGRAAQVSGLERGLNTISVSIVAEDGTTRRTYTVRVTRDVSRILDVSVDNTSVNEDVGGTVTFTVAFAAGSTAIEAGTPVTVDWTLSGGADSDDYTAPAANTGSLTYTTLTAQTVVVNIAQDTDNEAAETLTLTLSNAEDAGLGTESATATIAASDPITVAITTTTASVGEATTANYSVTLSGGARTADVVVPFTFGGTLSNAEYEITAPTGIAATATGGTLTFTAATSNLSLPITVNLAGDDLNEPAETLILTGTAPGATGLRTVGDISFSTNNDSATVSVTDDDAVTVTLDDATDISEGATATFAVNLSGASSADTVVNYTVTATQSASFTDAGSGSITIAAGDTSGNIEITADNSQAIMMGTREFTVTLGTVTNPNGSVTRDGTQSQTVSAEYRPFDRGFSVTVNEANGKTEDRNGTLPGIQVYEGDTVYFNVSIGMGGTPITADATVDWTPGGDTAATTGGTLTFTTANQATAQEVTVVASDDNINNADGSLNVTLSNAGLGSGTGTIGVGTATATVTVEDNDTITFSAGGNATISVTEAAVGTDVTATFPVTLSGAAGGSAWDGFSIPVTVVATGTTATAADYTAAIASVDFTTVVTNTERSGTATITITGDNLNEAAETLIVELGETAITSGTGGGRIARAANAADYRRTITITDDDAVTVTVGRSGGSTADLTEGGAAATFTVTVSGAILTSDLTVNAAVSGTDITASDYTLSATSVTVSPATGPTATADFTVTALADNANEAAETMTITISNASTTGASSITTATATVGIAESDPVTFTVARAAGEGATANEGATVDFTISRSAHLNTTAMVPFTIGGTGITADDYDITAPTGIATTATGGTASFAATDTMVTVTVSLASDSLNEPAETLTITGGTITGYTGPTEYAASGGDAADVSINASDPLNVTLSDAADITEGNTAVFTLTLNNASSTETTILYTFGFGGGSATGTTEVTPLAGQGNARIPAGMTTADIRITPTSTTDVDSGTRIITITVNGLSTGTGGGPRATPSIVTGSQMATVTYVAVARTVELTVNTASGKTVDRDTTTTDVIEVNEGDTVYYSVAVALSGGDANNAPSTNVMVDWAATAGDYSTAAGTGATLTFTGGTSGNYATAQEFTVVAMEDTINEGNEDLVVTLSNAAGGGGLGTGLGTGTATVTVLANDAITYAIAATASGTEPDGTATTEVNVAVTLSGATESAYDNISIPFSVATTGTAAASEYSVAAGPLVFSGTFAAQNIVVTLNADDVNEADETIIINLGETAATTTGNGGSVTAGVRQSTVTINDDDDIAATMSIAAGSGDAIDEGATTTVQVTLDHASVAATTVNYAIGVVVAANIMPTDTMADDINLTHSGDGTTADLMGSIEIPAGETTGTFTITADPDTDVDSGTATLTVTFGDVTTGATGGDASGSGTQEITVTFFEFVRFFTVTLADAAVSEGGTVAFSVGFSGGSVAPMVGNDAMVTWTLSGTALAADHSGARSGMLTFTNANWQTRQTVSVPITADNLNEAAETLILTLSAATGGDAVGSGIQTAAATATIGASDPITYAITSNDVSRRESDSTLTATFTVTLSGASAGSVFSTINVPFSAAAESTATASTSTVPADYTLSTSPLAFTGTDTTAEITVTVVDDDINEPSETVILSLGAAMGDGAGGGMLIAATGDNATATLTINDDDQINYTITRATGTGEEVAEGENAVFTVTLSGAAEGSVTVPYRVNAQNAGDFTDTAGGSLTIATGTTTGTITIAINADGLEEGNESLRVELQSNNDLNSRGVRRGNPSSQQITIPANPAAAHIVTVTGPDAAVTEGTSAMFTFSLPAVTGENARTESLVATFEIATTSVETSDYTAPATLTVTFPHTGEGATTQTVPIPILADNLNEGEETLTLTLTGVNPQTADNMDHPGLSAASDSATATIAASDDITVTIANAAAVTEGADGAMLVYTVTLTGATGGSAAAVTVPFSINTGDSTASGNDYTNPSDRTLDIAAGVTSGTIAIAITDDDLNEANETIIVTLGNNPATGDGGGNIAISETAATASGTITDDDAITVAISGPDSEVRENSDARFTFTLMDGTAEVASGQDVTVMWMATVAQDHISGEPESNSDSAPEFRTSDALTILSGGITASGSVTVRRGSRTATVNIPIANDGLGENAEALTVAIQTVTAIGVTADTNANSAAVNIAASEGLQNRVRVVATAGETTAVSEDNGAAAFTLSLRRVLVTDEPQEVRVNYSIATAPPLSTSNGLTVNDFVGGATGGSVTFAADCAPAAPADPICTATVNVQDDALNEGTERRTLRITGVNVGGGQTSTVQRETATAVIDESDPLDLRLVRVDADGEPTTAAIVPGEDLRYEVSYGMAMVLQADGTRTATAIMPTQQVTANVMFTAGSATATHEVRLSPGREMQVVSVPQSALEPLMAAFAAGTPATVELMVMDTTVPVSTTPTQTPAMRTIQLRNYRVDLTRAEYRAVGGKDLRFRIDVRGAARTSQLMLTVMVDAPPGLTTVPTGAMPASDMPTDSDYTNPAMTFTVPAGSGRTSHEIRVATFEKDATDAAVEYVRMTISEPGSGMNIVFVRDTAIGLILQDNPEARASRMKTMLASLGRSVAQLAGEIVEGRIGGLANPQQRSTLSIGGKAVSAMNDSQRAAASGDWAANPFEREKMMADTFSVSGGKAMTTAEILRGTSFNLVTGGADGTTMWGGARLSAMDGNYGVLKYDGDVKAYMVGLESRNDDTLFGMGVAHTAGDLDFTDSSVDVSGNLQSRMFSLHPYMARRINERTHLWGTLGYGRADVNLTEDGDGVETAMNVLMGSFGASASREYGDGRDSRLRLSLSTSESRMDAATLDNKEVRGVKARAVRIGGEWEYGWTRELQRKSGSLRWFGLGGLRKDFRDAQQAAALDIGGGIALQTDDGYSLKVRATTQVNETKNEEQSLSADFGLNRDQAGFSPFTRMSVNNSGSESMSAGVRYRNEGGRFGLTVQADFSDDSRTDWGQLISGEWRF